MSIVIADNTHPYFSLLRKKEHIDKDGHEWFDKEKEIPLIKLERIYRFNKFANTREFKRSGLHWMKYGKYTNAPKGHPEYRKFWDRETERCLHGMWVGDVYCPPKMYFYLNYLPIKRVPSKDYLELHPSAPRNIPVVEFPAFWEIDYAWWNFVTYSEQQGVLGNKNCHKVVLKTRQGGFSFKEAADGVYNYTFYKNLINKYFAATESYLVKDGIFNKVENMLNHLNQHTIWKQQRRIKDNTYHKKGSYWSKVGKHEKGRKNELIAQVMDHPDKARGGNSVKITFEEAGNNKYLLEAWMTTLPQVTKGGITTGFMTAFGTGGTKEAEYLEGLEEMFYNPNGYKAIAFDNIWESGMQDTECGFFVPMHYTMENCMDDDCNLDWDMAQNEIDTDRTAMSGTKMFEHHKAENPITPTEALTRVASSLFSKDVIAKQRIKVENSKRIKSLLVSGTLLEYTTDEGMEVKFRPEKDLDIIDEYPINQNNLSQRGGLVIEQQPYKDPKGNIPEDMYVIGFDPYYKDQAPNSPSIGGVRVFKVPNKSDNRPNDKFVAWMDMRPERKSILWKKIILLAIYYNAKIYFEIDGGGQNFFEWCRDDEWAKRVNAIDYLAYEPESISRKENMGTQRNRAYGVKKSGIAQKTLERFANWMDEVRAIDMEGEEVKNAHRQYDVGLLKECQMHKDDGNFDRISSAELCILGRDEIVSKMYESKDMDDFFNRKLFTGSSNKSFDLGENVKHIRNNRSIVERY